MAAYPFQYPLPPSPAPNQRASPFIRLAQAARDPLITGQSAAHGLQPCKSTHTSLPRSYPGYRGAIQLTASESFGLNRGLPVACNRLHPFAKRCGRAAHSVNSTRPSAIQVLSNWNADVDIRSPAGKMVFHTTAFHLSRHKPLALPQATFQVALHAARQNVDIPPVATGSRRLSNGCVHA